VAVIFIGFIEISSDVLWRNLKHTSTWDSE
jgi:hypothetical protein